VLTASCLHACQVLHNPVTLDLLALPEAGRDAADGTAAAAGAGTAAEIQHFALPCAEWVFCHVTAACSVHIIQSFCCIGQCCSALWVMITSSKVQSSTCCLRPLLRCTALMTSTICQACSLAAC
jgi:hypothetical protein